MSRIPVLVAIGDFASGVTSWAFRLRSAFATHPKYDLRLINCRRTGNKMGSYDVQAFTREQVRDTIAAESSVVVVPNFVFDLFQICAELGGQGHDVRTIGFCRADSEREYYAPLRFYEPAITQFCAVSPLCVERLADYVPHRKADISVMPTGVHVPKSLKRSYQTNPLRIVYGGRIVQMQKRVMDFVPLVEALLDRGVEFTFHIVGQGRGLADLKDAMALVPHAGRVVFQGKVLPEKMEALWGAHDIFVQTSDFEGTSNSMLESMAQGTIPVMTLTESGVAGIIREGENGFLVPVGDMEAMADVIAGLAGGRYGDLDALGSAAHETTKEYSIERYVERFAAVLDAAMERGPVSWPAEQPSTPDFEVHGIHLEDTAPKAAAPGFDMRECLKNRAFSERDNGSLAAWHTPPSMRAGAQAGEIMLAPADANVYLQQSCELGVFGEGAWVDASVSLRTSEKDVVGFNCYLECGDYKKTYSVSHSGGGAWETLSHHIMLPRGTAPATVRFFLVLRAQGTQPAELRAPSMRLYAPQEQLPDLTPFTEAAVPPREAGEKRLLILFPSPLRGGAEDYCVTMAKGAVAAGWNVHVGFAPRQATASLIRDFTMAGAQYHPLDVVDVGPRPSRATPLRRYVRSHRLLRKVQPSAVLLELCGMQYGLGPMAACAALGIPTAVIFQMVREGVHVGPRQRWARAVLRQRRQRYVAVSNENRELIARALKMSPSAISMISNGANPERFIRSAVQRGEIRLRLRRELGVPEDCRLLLTVGRLAEQKGHDLLIPMIPHVIEQHPNTRFIWAGEGPMQRALEKQIEEYGVKDSVVLLGRRSDIPDLLNGADLFVLPTRFEGQPFSMLEAMAARIPVVTTRASAICEVVEHRTHGLLSPVEDIRDFRENLLYALSHMDEMRAMADRAGGRLEGFTEQAMIEETLTLLEKTGA